MKNKSLIIHLLVQEFKFSQLISGLGNYKLVFEEWLDIHTAVATLLGKKEEEITDDWTARFSDASKKAVDLGFWNESDLHLLAEETFIELASIVEN